MYDLLRNRAHALTAPALDLACELVQTPSYSLDELRAASVVERTMRGCRFDRVVRDDYGNVLGILFGAEPSPTLLVVSHMDTVPAGDAEAWQDSPFSGRTEHGRLRGVGAADCKGGIAAQLFAAVALQRSLLPLRGNLVVAATVAEENGAALGVRALLGETLPALGLRPDFAILGEPTDLGVYYGHEGWAVFDIHLQGTDPFQVADAAHAVHADFGRNGASGRHNNGKANFAVAAPNLAPGDAEPNHAVVSLTRRLLHGESPGDVIALTRYCASSAAQAAGAVGVDVEIAQERQQLCTGQCRTVSRVTLPWVTDPFSPLAERSHHALAAAGCKFRPGQWTLDRLGMGTAGGALVHDFRIPTIGYGPGNEQAAHARDEYLETASLEEAIYGTAAIAHSLVGVPVFGWTAEEI